MIKKYSSNIQKIITLLLFMTGLNLYAMDAQQSFIENANYKVISEIKSGQLVIKIKNKANNKIIEHRQEIAADSDKFSMQFLSDDAFIIETDLGTGKAVYLGIIKNPIFLKVYGFRVSRYILNSDKTLLIYSNWVTPLDGPTDLSLLDLNELKQDRLNEKNIFSTNRFVSVDKDLIISPDNVIWDGDGKIFILCEKEPQLTEHYLFVHDLKKNVGKFVAKLSHKPGTILKSFKWNEQKKELNYVYESKKGKEKNIYTVPFRSDD